ncbi:MAG: Fic family protein [Coriobacteriia bacterium]|nr:Fic family protein [Coriobacteriia bacterium]
MSYSPSFDITPQLLGTIEEVAVLRQQIADASVELAWIPALQKDSRMRNTHASTAIEGNPLTLPEVRAIADDTAPPARLPRSRQEVVNYLAGLRYIEQHADAARITEDSVLQLHRILASDVMDQGFPGEYRSISVQVGRHRPPSPEAVSQLTRELIDWWNGPSRELSPVLTSAVVHYRLEAIHPFADCNGRIGRTLALWELYRRGFDTHHIFSVDEFYWQGRERYYAELSKVDASDGELTSWLEYAAAGIRATLEAVLDRIRRAGGEDGVRIALRPKQERLLQMLSAAGSMAPREIWEALAISRQGAMDLLNPLVDAGLVEKVGTRKTGRYRLRSVGSEGSGQDR